MKHTLTEKSKRRIWLISAVRDHRKGRNFRHITPFLTLHLPSGLNNRQLDKLNWICHCRRTFYKPTLSGTISSLWGALITPDITPREHLSLLQDADKTGDFTKFVERYDRLASMHTKHQIFIGEDFIAS